MMMVGSDDEVGESDDYLAKLIKNLTKIQEISPRTGSATILLFLSQISPLCFSYWNLGPLKFIYVDEF
jgi:hypothetical protein